MIPKSEKKEIQYECNRCKKTRIIIIHKNLHNSVDEKGYVEYVDVHPCVDDKLSANILYVDKFLTVRSQVPVKVGDDLTLKQIEDMNIPVPKRVDLKEEKIIPHKQYKPKNLRSLVIADNLRRTKYTFRHKEGSIKVSAHSELNYITIEATVEKNISSDYATSWVKQLASLLEAIVLLDTEMLSFLIWYLDSKLTTIPSGESLLELDIIIHAKNTFPESSLKTYSIFRRQWSSLKNQFGGKEYKNYDKIITRCIGNQHRTVLDVYQQLCKEMSFPEFIDHLEDLSMVGVVNLKRVEFVVIKDPDSRR